jgi:hypothetical protein
MKYYDHRIKKIFSHDSYQDENKIRRVYVMYDLKTQAEYEIGYQENINYFVVTDVYEVIYKDKKPKFKNKYEFYYSSKETIDDLFSIKSIKIFMDSDKHFRTDWFDKNNRKICYRTIEGHNRKFENVIGSDGFYEGNQKYEGPLSELSLSESILQEVINLNDNHLEYKNSCSKVRM